VHADNIALSMVGDFAILRSFVSLPGAACRAKVTPTILRTLHFQVPSVSILGIPACAGITSHG